MIDVTATRAIPAGPQAIWPLLDEAGRLGSGSRSPTAARSSKAPASGGASACTATGACKRSEIDQVVLEHDPPRRLAWRHEAERLDAWARSG